MFLIKQKLIENNFWLCLQLKRDKPQKKTFHCFSAQNYYSNTFRHTETRLCQQLCQFWLCEKLWRRKIIHRIYSWNDISRWRFKCHSNGPAVAGDNLNALLSITHLFQLQRSAQHNGVPFMINGCKKSASVSEGEILMTFGPKNGNHYWNTKLLKKSLQQQKRIKYYSWSLTEIASTEHINMKHKTLFNKR